jgi:hypothetical protein
MDNWETDITTVVAFLGIASLNGPHALDKTQVAQFKDALSRLCEVAGVEVIEKNILPGAN